MQLRKFRFRITILDIIGINSILSVEAKLNEGVIAEAASRREIPLLSRKREVERRRSTV